jgi:hypothetical protein
VLVQTYPDPQSLFIQAESWRRVCQPVFTWVLCNRGPKKNKECCRTSALRRPEHTARGQHLLRIDFCLAVSLLVAGCAVDSVAMDEPSSEDLPNFRSVILANLEAHRDSSGDAGSKSNTAPEGMAIFPATMRVSDVEVSDAQRRMLTALHGWAWQTCMRATVGGVHGAFAVFVVKNRVVDARSAVAIDQCEKGNYTPLPVNRPEPPSNSKKQKQ